MKTSKNKFIFFVSTNFEDIISIRIAIGSGTAFIIAQLVDVEIFQILRKRKWYVAPVISSIFGSTIDTFVFFYIAFFGTGINWISLSFGDLCVKLLVAIIMLIPFKFLISHIAESTKVKKKINM